MVRTTVHIDGAMYPRLPVRTVAPVPKERVAEICRELRSVTISAPIRRREIIQPNVLGIGVDVVASRTMTAR